ncbi:MAG: GDP-mannose 4,6 dehydratase, partial [Gaiellaceae bacterium]|nr:GDP-mannose 4,6 dehydratase [Gaiellaceae bacterium]
NVGSGRSISVGDLVRTCEQVVGHPVEVEVEAQRRRARDRAELVADARLLRDVTGWQPTRTLKETLSELLKRPKAD